MPLSLARTPTPTQYLSRLSDRLLISEVQQGNWGQRVLFWHTGGAFGLFGRGRELVET